MVRGAIAIVTVMLLSSMQASAQVTSAQQGCPNDLPTGCKPFSYHGVQYSQCTDIGSGGTGHWSSCWCATNPDPSGAFVIGSGEYVSCGEKASPPVTSAQLGCPNDLPPQCQEFSYYGVWYSGCTDVGTHGNGHWDSCWCATQVDSEGAFVVGSGKWASCGDKAAAALQDKVDRSSFAPVALVAFPSYGAVAVFAAVGSAATLAALLARRSRPAVISGSESLLG